MSRLNALCVAVLCLEDPGEARAFVCAAAAIPDDDWVEYALSKHTGKNLRAWVRWLAGQEPLPSRFEESLSPGVDAALRADTGAGAKSWLRDRARDGWRRRCRAALGLKLLGAILSRS